MTARRPPAPVPTAPASARRTSDSTQEVQILTAAYAAEYGRTSGAQIRIITEAGGQQFHGAAYEYVRNTIFNANTWHAITRRRARPAAQQLTAPFHYNQYGYNIGGPFYIPGKFNTRQEQVLLVLGTGMGTYRFTDTAPWTVPTALMRQGNFSELLTEQPGEHPTAKWFNSRIRPPGNPIPGNIIPASLLSQNGLGILKAYPDADIPIGTARRQQQLLRHGAASSESAQRHAWRST